MLNEMKMINDSQGAARWIVTHVLYMATMD